jgi:HlyD family secretion protein
MMNKRGKRKRLYWVFAASILMIAVLVSGCVPAGANDPAAEALSAGDTVAAFVGDLSSSASASGQLQPKQQARLALSGSGTVAQVPVQVGERVAAGQALAQLETDELERAVQNAEQNLAIQEANLAALISEPDAEDIASAEASVADAQAQLDDLLAGPSEAELAQAQAALDSALTQLDDLLAGASATERAQAQAALDSARENLETVQARHAAQQEQVVVAQNDINSAQTTLDRARDAYDQLIWNNPKAAGSWGPYSPQGVALDKAQINYDAAVANYNLTLLDANDSALRSAEAQVAQAEASLEALTEEQTVQIASARAQVARAEKDLEALTDNAVQIAATRAQLAQAESNLAQLLDGASDEQVASARISVEQARLQLEDAQTDLDKATLVAPFGGYVTDVYVAGGELASGAAVELVNTETMQVVLDVDEVDLDQVKVGQEVTVELEAWPDQIFQGHVASIAPVADDVNGIVSYQVRLDVDWGPGDALPLTGMTADADLITGKRKDVVLVANRAIVADRDTGNYYVYAVSDEGETTTQVQVTIGMRDSNYTEITSGLNEGDIVTLNYSKTTVESPGGMGPGGLGRGPGGLQ